MSSGRVSRLPILTVASLEHLLRGEPTAEGDARERERDGSGEAGEMEGRKEKKGEWVVREKKKESRAMAKAQARDRCFVLSADIKTRREHRKPRELR